MNPGVGKYILEFEWVNDDKNKKWSKIVMLLKKFSSIGRSVVADQLLFLCWFLGNPLCTYLPVSIGEFWGQDNHVLKTRF